MANADNYWYEPLLHGAYRIEVRQGTIRIVIEAKPVANPVPNSTVDKSY
jgi:hypothetical protein